MQQKQRIGASNDEVDMNLYSRQLGTFGLETMSKLVGMKVLISGLQGVGVETAKNLILAGPGLVTLHDPSIVDIADLGSNFYLRESDVGVNTRSEGSLRGLKNLNSYVDVQVYTGELNDAIIREHNCLIVCNVTRQRLMHTNEICRRHGVGFIAAAVYGLAFSVFVDFGDEFKVLDVDGEEPKQAIVESIVAVDTTRTIINCVDERRLPFSVGDFVALSEIQGLEPLNHIGPIQIIGTSKHSFEIAVDVTAMGNYTKGGLVTQVKKPAIMKFRSYAEACARPLPEGVHCLQTPDLGKFGRSEQLHIAMQALLAYEGANECIPESRDAKAIEQITRLAQELNDHYKDQKHTEGVVWVEEVDVKVVEAVASFALCHVAPVATCVGGIVAQEAIKMTGRYTPLHQWLYLDAFEILDGLDINPKDCQPLGTRIDDLLVMWGSQVQRILSKLNIFLVGAGALGCEYLKNFAMLGIATHQDGLVTITDMDQIEISNLNRQFLFHKEHVGQSKAVTAALAVKEMNPAMNVRCLETRVGVETEETFTDEFWDKQDIIVNALDNIPSRQYVDGKCVWHMKPLLESGTLGTKANIQVVVPSMTESYGDSQDPPEESIPLCTLRHFPNQIEHTIEWSRDLFQGLFNDAVLEAKKMAQCPDGALKALSVGTSVSQKKERLEKVVALLETLAPKPSFENCIKLAVRLFHELFNVEIAQLLYNFPIDHVTSNGAPFWSGPKRAPRILKLDVNDPTHLSFVVSASNLFAAALCIPANRQESWIAGEAAQVPLSVFQPRKVVIKTDENEPIEECGADDEAVCQKFENRIRDILSAITPNPETFRPLEFEKDDDTNFHIDFMAVAGNLRARNYGIAEVPRWKAKIIAGKIIPAIATTTAMVTGLAVLELIKLATLQGRPIEHFKNCFASLALPMWLLSEPIPPKKNVDLEYEPIVGGPVRARPRGFTTWDKWTVDLRGKTMADLMKAIEKEFNTQVAILSAGNICLYNAYDKRQQERLESTLDGLLARLTKNEATLNLTKNYIVVQACCTDVDGVDVNIPTIKCIFK